MSETCQLCLHIWASQSFFLWFRELAHSYERKCSHIFRQQWTTVFLMKVLTETYLANTVLTSDVVMNMFSSWERFTATCKIKSNMTWMRALASFVGWPALREKSCELSWTTLRRRLWLPRGWARWAHQDEKKSQHQMIWIISKNLQTCSKYVHLLSATLQHLLKIIHYLSALLQHLLRTKPNFKCNKLIPSCWPMPTEAFWSQ